MGDRTERRILRGLTECRPEACRTVIETHYRSVYRLLCLLTRDAGLAEDLTQEVFASAWQAVGEFRGDASIRTWLHRIAYNAFINVRRRQRRERTVATTRRNEGLEPAADPLSAVMADEHVGRVYDAMDDLDVNDRTILLLHYVEGLSYREMAQVLGRSDGTLKWLTSRALEKLRKRLTGKVET